MGYYSEQLERYFTTFDRSQIRVYLYEDYVKKPLQVIQDMFGFIGVDDTFVPDMSSRANISMVPRNWRLHQLMKGRNAARLMARALLPFGLRARLRTAILDRNLVRPHLAPEIRRELIEVYRSDILRLQELLGKDLSSWLI
jgi:hypothetical protein